MSLSQLPFGPLMLTLSISLVLGACSSDDGTNELPEHSHGEDGTEDPNVPSTSDQGGASASTPGCDVSEDDGVITVTCGDSVAQLEAPAPCTITEDDSSVTLTCGSETLSFSTAVANVGLGGAPAASPSCFFEEKDGAVVLTCGSETVSIPTGMAAGDTSCTISENTPGLATISCPDESTVDVLTCGGQPSYCDAGSHVECRKAQGWVSSICEGDCVEYGSSAYCEGGAGGAGGAGG
jgi:hypothetical protein